MNILGAFFHAFVLVKIFYSKKYKPFQYDLKTDQY